MQYKDAKKIMIDQRKLETLFRIGCPDNLIIELLKTKTFTPTGDSLIDDNLETLLDYRYFVNNGWGGKRKGAGRKSQKTYKNNHLENQDENQLDNQDANQNKIKFVDIDKDIDNKKNKFNINSVIYVNGQYFDEFPHESVPTIKKYWTDETIEKIRKDLAFKPDHETTVAQLLLTYPSDQVDIDAEFEKFWDAYIPVKTNDGRVVNKGSKKETLAKYTRIIKSGAKPADILKGLNAYLIDCRNNNRFTCGATVFLNQERWKDEYNTKVIVAQQTTPMSAKERTDMINKQKTEALLKTMREKGLLQ